MVTIVPRIARSEKDRYVIFFLFVHVRFVIFLPIITGRELSKIGRPISRRNDRRTSLLSTG